MGYNTRETTNQFIERQSKQLADNAFTECVKVARRHYPGAPIGIPSPMYLVCFSCKRELPIGEDRFVFCDCGQIYNQEGYVQRQGGAK